MIKEPTILNPQAPENKPPAESFSGEKKEFRNKKLEKTDYSDTGENNFEEKEENSKKSIDNSKEKETNEETAKEVMERIFEDYEKLIALKGKHGADQLFSQILESAPKEKILQASEYMSDLNEAREKAFNKLKEIGIIQEAPEGGLICDIDGLKNLDSGFIESLGSIYSSKYMGKRSTRRALDLLFEDKKIISREDYENSQEKEFKDLFYSPKTKKEALDIEKIKGSKFYLTFNDVMSKINDNKFGYGSIPKEDLSFKEALLPVLIYHPQYGAGYRDPKTNKLIVKNEKGEYRVFSGQYLIDRFGVRGKKNLAVSRDYFKNELPNLLENGILNSEDFRRQRFISEEVESYRAFRKISRRGMVMFNKIRYTLGSDFDPKKGNFEACQISSDIGGVVKTSEDGKKEIVATFKIVKKEEANKTEKGYLTVGIEQADVKKYSKEDVYLRRPEEDDEDYQKRIKDYEDFNLIIEVSDYISQETGINIANFNFKEQQMISALAEKTNYENDNRFVDFVKKFGMSGLKTCLSIEYEDGMGENILEISENLKRTPELAIELFSEYARIVESAEEKIEEFSRIYKEVFFDKEINEDKIREAILREGSELLKIAITQLNGAEEDKKPEVIKNLIFDLRREGQIQKSVIENLVQMFNKLNNQCDEIETSSFYGEEVDYGRIQNLKRKRLERIKNEKPEFYERISDFNDKYGQKIKIYEEKRIKELLEYVEHGLNRDIETIKQLNSLSSGQEKYTETIKNLENSIEQKKQKKEKLRSILSLRRELEKKLDDFIFGKKEAYNQEQDNPIFKKYQEIIDEAKNIRQNIKSFYKKEKDISEEDIDSITDSMLKRANALLKDYSDRLQKGEDVDQADFKDKLEAQKADTAVFASIFENAYKKDKIGFDELRGVGYKTKNSLELNDQERKMIIDVVRRNYPDKKQQKDILEKIEKSFTSEQTKWHLLTRQREDEESLVSCVRFDEIDEKNVYAATFNVGVDYRGSKLGEAMFDHVMTEVAKTKKIKAIAEMGKTVSDFYINRGGFNVKELEINQKTGKKYYKIERLDSENEFYGTKKVENEKDLLAYYDEKADIKDLVNIEKYILVKKEEVDKEADYESINFILKNDYLLTRIVKHNWESYLVFEKKVSASENKKQVA